MVGRVLRRLGLSSIPTRSMVSMSLLAAGVVIITTNLALGGSLLALDKAIVDLEVRDNFRALLPFADWADRIGQRAVCLPLLFLLVFVIWRRYGFRRPIVIAIVGNLGLNFIVGVLKLATARQSPRSGEPEFFLGNVLYPSGHAGNVVFVYGLMAVFALRYGMVHPRRKPILVAGVAGITGLMFLISMYRDTHWLTDLVVGAMLGGIALELAMIADRQWPWIRSIAEQVLLAVLWVVAPLRAWDARPRSRVASPARGDDELERVVDRPADRPMAAPARPPVEEPSRWPAEHAPPPNGEVRSRDTAAPPPAHRRS